MDWIELPKDLSTASTHAGASLDGEVDLAGGLVPLVVRHELRQRTVLLAQGGQHVQCREHAGIGAPEITEVVVRRVFPAEDGPGLGHQSP